MGTTANSGFTVIESMLFLAVAGALTIGVLVGSGAAINQQRYKDSVVSLKSFIQQQYNEVTNVVNGRVGTEACANAVVVPPGATTTAQARGTSECLLMGRYVTVDTSGTVLTASNVVGYRTNPDAPEAASDALEISSNYRLGVSSIGQDSIDVAWGATVVKPQTNEPLSLSILILRSPLSGSIMTYTSEGATSNLVALVNAASSNTPRNLCVHMPSGIIATKRMSVQISSFATNQGAIQIPPESTSVCD